MTYQPATNRRFYEGPDVETLNILIELGEIVKHSEPVVWDIVPKDTSNTRGNLIHAAVQAILGVKALRSVKSRLQEPFVPPTEPSTSSIKWTSGKPYDFRLPVFPRGDAA